jgi:hypothetical protein
MLENIETIRWILLVTILIYFVFDRFDSRQIKDERENLIQMKTYELVHKVTTTILLIIALIYVFLPSMNALFPVLALSLAFLYTEIFGKIYYRRKF